MRSRRPKDEEFFDTTRKGEGKNNVESEPEDLPYTRTISTEDRILLWAFFCWPCYSCRFTGVFLEEKFANRNYFSLSGGEKQRILLAKVLAQKCKFIVLDEATNHLDVKYQYQIMEGLKKEKVTVFSSIHDLNIAAMYCDKIVVIEQGRIVDFGSPEDILTEEKISALFNIGVQSKINDETGKLQIYYYPKIN